MTKKTDKQPKKKEEKKEVLTREDFMNFLKKISRPIPEKQEQPQAKGKSKTSE